MCKLLRLFYQEEDGKDFPSSVLLQSLNLSASPSDFTHHLVLTFISKSLFGEVSWNLNDTETPLQHRLIFRRA